jgi:DNA-binding NarL/FixJ family response regulator
MPTTDLTPRELQVLQLLAHGRKLNEIAAELGIGCHGEGLHRASAR